MRVKICSAMGFLFWFRDGFTYYVCNALIVYCTSIHENKNKNQSFVILNETEKNKSDFGLPLFHTFVYNSFSRAKLIFKHAHTYTCIVHVQFIYNLSKIFELKRTTSRTRFCWKNQRKWKRREWEKNQRTKRIQIGAHFHSVFFISNPFCASVCVRQMMILFTDIHCLWVDRLNIKFSEQSMSHWISHQSDIAYMRAQQTAFTDHFRWIFTCEVCEQAYEYELFGVCVQ